MKDELGERTIMESVTLRPKTYSYLTDDCKEDKKAIDDLEGYFDFSHNLGYLNLLFDDDNKQNKYYQVWKEILKAINGGHGKIRSSKEIRLFNNDLPIGYVFKIDSITIVIESLIEKK